MTDLADLVSFGDLTPISQLRRAQVEHIARKHGIQFRPDAPKEKTIQALEAAGIDIMKPENGIDWETVRGKDERGHETAFAAPRHVSHQSERNGVDSNAILQQKLSDTEAKNDAQMDEIARLKAENARLKEEFGARLAALEQKAEPQKAPEPPARPKKLGYRDLYRMAKDAGLPVKAGMKKAELEALLDGHENAAQRSQ